VDRIWIRIACFSHLSISTMVNRMKIVCTVFQVGYPDNEPDIGPRIQRGISQYSHRSVLSSADPAYPHLLYPRHQLSSGLLSLAGSILRILRIIYPGSHATNLCHSGGRTNCTSDRQWLEKENVIMKILNAPVLVLVVLWCAAVLLVPAILG
jgi:hypothetical protein